MTTSLVRSIRMLAASVLLVACGGETVRHLPDGPGTLPDGPSVDGLPPPADAEVLTPVTCGAPTRLDTLGGVGNVKAATLSPGKYVVSWDENPAAAPRIAKARVFDGTQFVAEQTFTSPPAGTIATIAADGQGRGYAAWLGATLMGRSVLEPGGSAFGTPTSIPTAELALAGLPSGAVLLTLASGPGGFPSPTVSVYDPGAATWSSPLTLLDGNFRVEALGVSATGKAAISWLDTFAPGVPLYVTTFDGTWSTPSSTFLTPVGSGLQYLTQTPAVYANGDVLFVYGVSSTTTGAAMLESMRYHAATGVFDPPISLDGPGASAPRVFIDAMDRVTVVYHKDTELFATRDLGAGWTAAIDLGAGAAVIAETDAAGNLATVLQPANQSGMSTLRRITATGSTWTEPVPTGFGPTNSSPETSIAIAFDAAHHPVVFAKQIVATHTELHAVVCQ